MVVIKLLALGLFIAVGAMHINPANYTPFAPNGFTGIHQGAAIVFFAYIGFDAISTAAEETRNPQRNLPIGILGGLAICTLIYVIVGVVLTGMVPYTELGGRRPAGARAQARRLPGGGLDRRARRGVSMTAVLLVFQYGQPRIFFAMARDGLLPQWAARVHPKTRPVGDDAADRGRRGAGVAHRRRRRDLRPDQHRDALRLRARVRRRAGAARTSSPTAPRPFRCRRLGRRAARRCGVPLHHGRAAAAGVGAVRHLAGHRAPHLRFYGYRTASRDPRTRRPISALSSQPKAAAPPADGPRQARLNARLIASNH